MTYAAACPGQYIYRSLWRWMSNMDTCRGMSRAAQPQESLEVDVEQDTGHSTVGEDWQNIAVEEQGLMNILRKAQTGRAE